MIFKRKLLERLRAIFLKKQNELIHNNTIIDRDDHDLNDDLVNLFLLDDAETMLELQSICIDLGVNISNDATMIEEARKFLNALYDMEQSELIATESAKIHSLEELIRGLKRNLVALWKPLIKDCEGKMPKIVKCNADLANVLQALSDSPDAQKLFITCLGKHLNKIVHFDMLTNTLSQISDNSVKRHMQELFRENVLVQLINTSSSLSELENLKNNSHGVAWSENVISVCKQKFYTLIQTNEDLRKFLLAFNNDIRLKTAVIEAIEPKLGSIIKSGKETFDALLKMVSEESEVYLQKKIIEAFEPDLITFAQLETILRLLAESANLQRVLIVTLNESGKLTNLRKPGKEEIILELLQHDNLACSEARKAFKPTSNSRVGFFNHPTSEMDHINSEEQRLSSLQQRIIH